MAQINQRIPNFLGGVSQQPDKIKFPGQLRVCDNAVPDIRDRWWYAYKSMGSS